jgi:sulfate permease, SulP family
VEQVLLVASAINFVDGSALEALARLVERLQQMGVGFALAEVKGPVMDRLKRAGFVEKVGAERFFLSTHQAMQVLKSQTNSMPAAASG